MASPASFSLLVTLALSCQHVMASDVHKDTTTMCILDDQPQEVYLECIKGLINIKAVFVGHQDIPQNQSACTTTSQDECTVPITETGPIFQVCQGMSKCNKVIYNPTTDRCGKLVNYVQVDYECIADNQVDPYAVVDICGDIFGSLNTLTRTQGYIRSLGYPDTYSPQTSCSCNFTTSSPTDTLQLTVVDISLTDQEGITNLNDWLEYSHSIKQWGHGYKLNQAARDQTIDISGGDIFLNFRTDNANQDRGFWIKYDVLAANGSPADVKLHCGRYVPPDYKTDINCYQEQGIGEMYLNCQSQGVINIISAVRGFQPNLTFESCNEVSNFTCSEDASNDADLFSECMGRAACNPPARQKAISTCGEDSNYMQVTYQCIREATSIIDMCGDATQNQFLTRPFGYLQTLGYPHAYVSNQRCTCRLRTTEQDARITLSLMDVNLDDSDCTNAKDRVEYTVSGQTWGRGIKLCGRSPGELIHTGAQLLYTNFFSDARIEGRGVWLKYLGKRPDGSLSPVMVICGQYDPNQDLPDHPAYLTPSPADNDGPITIAIENPQRAGMTIGLTVTAVAIIIVAVFIVVYRFRRPEKNTQKSTPVVTSSIPASSAGYGTLKYPGFSTKKDGQGMPYTNLDNERSVNSSLRERNSSISKISGRRVDSSKSDFSDACSSVGSSEAASQRSEIAYKNPAYDSAWDDDKSKDQAPRHLKI